MFYFKKSHTLLSEHETHINWHLRENPENDSYRLNCKNQQAKLHLQINFKIGCYEIK